MLTRWGGCGVVWVGKGPVWVEAAVSQAVQIGIEVYLQNECFDGREDR